MSDEADATSTEPPSEAPKWAAKPDLSVWTTKAEQGTTSSGVHSPAAPSAPFHAPPSMSPPQWPLPHHMQPVAPFPPPPTLMTPPSWPPVPPMTTHMYPPTPSPQPTHFVDNSRLHSQVVDSMRPPPPPPAEPPTDYNMGTPRQHMQTAPSPQNSCEPVKPPPPPPPGPGDPSIDNSRPPPPPPHMLPPPTIPSESLRAPLAPPPPSAQSAPLEPAPLPPPARPPADGLPEVRNPSVDATCHRERPIESSRTTVSESRSQACAAEQYGNPVTHFSNNARKRQWVDWSSDSYSTNTPVPSSEKGSYDSGNDTRRQKWSDWSSGRHSTETSQETPHFVPPPANLENGIYESEKHARWQQRAEWSASKAEWSSGSNSTHASKDIPQMVPPPDNVEKGIYDSEKHARWQQRAEWSSGKAEWSSSSNSTDASREVPHMVPPPDNIEKDTRDSEKHARWQQWAEWSSDTYSADTPKEVPQMVPPPHNVEKGACDSEKQARWQQWTEWSPGNYSDASKKVPQMVPPPDNVESPQQPRMIEPPASFSCSPPKLVLPPATSASPKLFPADFRDSGNHAPVLPLPPRDPRSAESQPQSTNEDPSHTANRSQMAHLPPPPPKPTRCVENEVQSPNHHAPQVLIPPAKVHQSEPQIVNPPPRAQQSEPQIVIPPLKLSQTEPKVLVPPPKAQHVEPQVVIPPPKRHQTQTDGSLIVLMVAEKPSIADTLAAALSNSTATKRTSSNRSPVFEYTDFFKGERAHFRVTSTHGHVYNLDFDKEYRDRERSNPGDLFSAPVVRSHDWRSNMPEHLANEARGCQALVLWLDCDREGENICFEVIDNASPVMDSSRTWSGAFRDRIFRAKFSCLSTADLQRAMANLSIPNENEAKSVSARQEIDLRLGVAFSRFLTQYFHQHFGENMKSMIHDVTYGPCQMPTLWFCVHRHCQVEAFVPKPFWKICAQVRRYQLEFQAELSRGNMWDEEEAQELHRRLQQISEVSVTSIERRRNTLQKPLPLNTVTMLQQASERVGISPGDAMYYAEQLYLKGILSYPRTETSRYPNGFDLNAVLYMLQRSDTPWANVAARVADLQVRPREDGEDHGDHPPITPVRWASERHCGDANAWALYQMVCRHFLATLSRDCILNETTVRLDLQGTEFVAVSSRRIVDAGEVDWCEAMGAQVEEKGAVDLACLTQVDTYYAHEVALVKEATKPPPHLSESDLLGLMEKHGIGTDASMAQHISNVLKRGYAKVNGKERHLIPTGMGLALSHAYTLVDPGLVRPTVRSSIENACSQVAKGRAQKEDVVADAVSVFERKFRHFTNRVDRVPAMLSVAYKRETPQSAAQWESAAKATAAVSLDDLLRARSSVEIGGDDAVQGKETLRTGTVVQISGLKGAAELNGQKGTCEQLDSATGRWHVRLASGTIKALKPENLQVNASGDLQVGARVRLHSLKGAAHLNGQIGTCESWDSSAGRWHVRLQSGEARALKPENISLASVADEGGTKRSRPEESGVDDEPGAKRLQVDDCDRVTLKKRIFKLCDKDADGFLNRDEMYALGVLSGFEGSADKWRVEYLKYVVGCTANMAKGIPLAGVLDLLDDISEDGCYCSDEQMRDFLKSH